MWEVIFRWIVIGGAVAGIGYVIWNILKKLEY